MRFHLLDSKKKGGLDNKLVKLIPWLNLRVSREFSGDIWQHFKQFFNKCWQVYR